MKGTYTALITPFKNGQVDYATYEALLEAQVKAGVDGVVPCGTTGESPTLSHEEHNEIVRFTVEKIKKRVKVIAGTGSNSTEESLRLSRHAEKVGADGCLLVCPYYNKPTQEGLFRHFKAVSDAVGLEIVVYNIPGRSGVKIGIETLARLAEIPNVVAVKDATGDIDMASETVAVCGEKLSVLSGNDSMNLPILAVGGTGTISVVSNIVPDRVKKMVDLYLKGETKKALEVHLALWQLSKVLFLETNPIPVKAAAHLLKMIPTEEIRLPLTSLEAPNREKLRAELKKIGLL